MPEIELSALAAEDVLPVSMVALVSFALGMIITILFVMARSGSGHNPVDTDYLEEEDEADGGRESSLETAGDQPTKAPPKEIWEKDPDWWKE